MRWPLGPGDDLEERMVGAFEVFLESLMGLGVVWEARPGGAAVWIPPDRAEAWDEAQRDTGVYALTDDGGRRWATFWQWIGSKIPDERLWHLDSIGVAPEMQGRGVGAALVDFGLAMARADGTGMLLETGSPGNVPYYERFGFRVVDDADAPDGGPRIWFMRWDP